MSRLIKRSEANVAYAGTVRAKHGGWPEGAGLSDFLAAPDISRSEEIETFGEGFDEAHGERAERIMGDLDEISWIVRELQHTYAHH